MCFVTETWTQYGNEPEHQYIKANLDTGGYKILTQSRENRKGGGIAAIYKSHLHIKKLYFKEYTSFEAQSNWTILPSHSFSQPSIEPHIQPSNL